MRHFITWSFSLLLAGAMMAPLQVRAASYITQAFSDAPSAAKFCSQHYTPNDVVRKDNHLTSQLYGKNGQYYTYYVKLNSRYLTDRNYAFEGAYYCLAEAAKSGWKEHKDDGSFALYDGQIRDIFVAARSVDSRTTYDEAVTICAGASNVMWWLRDYSKDFDQISSSAWQFYAHKGGLWWQRPAGAATGMTNQFVCLNQLAKPNQDYEVMDAQIKKNIADALAKAQIPAAQANALVKNAAVTRLTSGSGNTFVSPNGKQAYVLPKMPSAVALNPDKTITATYTGNGKTVSLTLSGVGLDTSGKLISANSGKLLTSDGNSLIATGGGNVVASGAGNIVSHDGGT